MVAEIGHGQGAMGTNWSRGSSVWTWGRTSLWGWWSTGTGCPGRLWSLPLWKYSKPSWMRSCAACCRWPCFGRGGGLDDPQRSLPTPNILWFCDSVLQWWRKIFCECQLSSDICKDASVSSALSLHWNITVGCPAGKYWLLSGTEANPDCLLQEVLCVWDHHTHSEILQQVDMKFKHWSGGQACWFP